MRVTHDESEVRMIYGERRSNPVWTWGTLVSFAAQVVDDPEESTGFEEYNYDGEAIMTDADTAKTLFERVEARFPEIAQDQETCDSEGFIAIYQTEKGHLVLAGDNGGSDCTGWVLGQEAEKLGLTSTSIPHCTVERLKNDLGIETYEEQAINAAKAAKL